MSGYSQVDLGPMPVSLQSPLIETYDAMHSPGLEASRLRYDGPHFKRCPAADPRVQRWSSPSGAGYFGAVLGG